MSVYAGKQVLVTGGLGFIGSNLARALVNQGAEVSVVDSLVPEYGGNAFNVEDIRDQLTVHQTDIRNTVAMEPLLAGKSFLFNLAAQTSHVGSMQEPRNDLDINVTAQLGILEICRKLNPDIRVVFTSTRQIYGKPEYLPVDEQHPIHPPDVNGINKFAAESYHLLYSKVHGIRSSVLRLTNTYGPGMRILDARQTFLGVWIRAILEGSPIRVFGDGEQLRDFTYVDDCVDALLRAGADPAAQDNIYNLGSQETTSLLDLAKLTCSIGAENGMKSSYELVPFPLERKAIDIGDYYATSELICRELGWKAETSLRAGLTRTIRYYQQHHSRYLREQR